MLVTEIPSHALLGRLTFVAAVIVGGVLVMAYLRRMGARETSLLRQLESAGDLFSRHRLDGSFVYASRGFDEIFGVDSQRLGGRRGLPGWQVIDHADLAAAVQELASSMRPVSVVTQLRDGDGREVWLESVGRQVQGGGRRADPEIIVISRDVTWRHQAEAALAHSEQRLRLLTDNMQEILWLRVGSEIQYINAAFERIFGVPHEAMGPHGMRGWLAWVHAEDRDRLRLAIDDAVEHHRPLDEEFRIVRQDGQVRWLHARTVHVETSAEGEPVAVGVAADITGRRRAEEAIRAAAEHYRALYDGAHVGITITDIAGSVLYANPAAAELFGAGSAAELLSHLRRQEGIASLYQDENDRARFVAALQQDPRHRISSVQDMRRLDDSAMRLRVSCGLVTNPESGRPEILAILEDVTERLRAEEELRRSEERYRRLVEFLPEGVLVHDGQRVVLANPACARLLGCEPGSLAGRELDELVPPESRATFAVVNGVAAPADVRGPEEIWLKRRDGGLCPVAVTSLPLHDVAGATTMSVIKDLSTIRRAGDEIAAQQELLVALIETMPLGIVAKDLDQDLGYVVWNAYMESELGLAKDDVIGRTDRDLFPADVAAELRRQDQIAASRGLPQDLGELTLQLDDRRLDLHVVKVPVRDADGRVARVFSLVENVTRQKQLQARLQQSRKMEAVGRLAGAVAHDFNNMLQVVQGYTEAIGRGLDADDGLQDEVGLVLEAVGRARELVQRLLTYSRYDALRPEMVDLNGTVDQLVTMARGVLPAEIGLVVRQTPNLPAVYADPQQIEQALLNLVLNARDALPGQGRIEIETSIYEMGREFSATRPWARAGRYAQITVRDNGCGIPPDARDHVYEPFYTTKGFGQGTGLGLATTYNICKQHQGFIDFESELDVGTSFHVFLPVPLAGTLDTTGPVSESVLSGGRGELVMIVEDDDMVRSLTRQMLEKAGYRVLEAGDGEDALEVFMAHAAEVRLLVLDVVMPRMDGRQLYDNISELRPGVPVLFCSSYSADILESEYMLQVGGTLLSKPYRAADLIGRVRSMLDG
jgi:PAS domain S-box-containing protein